MSEPPTDWQGDLAITGMGLVTPVGLNAPATLAALRAGVSRLSQLPNFAIMVDEEEEGPVIGAEVPRLPAGRHGVARQLRMMTPALREAILDAEIDPEARIGVFLGTSGSQPGQRRLSDARRVQSGLLEAVSGQYHVHLAKVVPAGRAAALQALRSAALSLDNDEIDIALVGGVDSWVSPRSLLWLREQGKLMEYPRRTGMMPGEAAAFLALESPARAVSRGVSVYAHVTASAGRHEDIPYGEASNALPLAQAVRAVWDDVRDPHILMVTDQNGERYRMTEWGMAEYKALNLYDTMDWRTPADCIGDTGSASGGVTLAWAAQGLHRGYFQADKALVWGASDEGAREAVRVTATGGQG